MILVRAKLFLSGEGGLPTGTNKPLKQTVASALHFKLSVTMASVANLFSIWYVL